MKVLYLRPGSAELKLTEIIDGVHVDMDRLKKGEVK